MNLNAAITNEAMWKIAICTITGVLEVISLILVLCNRKEVGRRNKRIRGKYTFTVSESSMIMWIGFLVVTASDGVVIMQTLISEVTTSFIIMLCSVFGAAILFGLYMILRAIRRRLIVQRNEMTFYPTFARPYTFTVHDITSVKCYWHSPGMPTEVLTVYLRHNGRRRKFSFDNTTEVGYHRLREKILDEVPQEKLRGFEECPWLDDD